MRILSPEDTLLHLAVHAFRDLDFCTHNILDAHEVWHQWQPDPELLVEHAGRWGAKKVLFYLLFNCRAIMDTPVPDALLDTLKPSQTANGLNAMILDSSTVQAAENLSIKYRFIQLISQTTFPDILSRGVRFQAYYAGLRFKDLLTASRQQ